jgi:hypothetical protein
MTDTREMIAAELSALISSSQRLTASQERRRQWLLEQLGEADVSAELAAGLEKMRAMRDELMRREYPPEIDVREAPSAQC